MRVTVRSGERRMDLEISPNLPVAQLVPELLRDVYGAEDARAASQLAWTLSPPGGAPLPPASSLADLHFNEGAELQLEQAIPFRGPVERAAPDGPGGSVGRDGLRPSERTLSTLPHREGAADRLMGTLSALVRPAPALPERILTAPAPGRVVPAEQVTLRRPRAPLDRARARWEESRYAHRLERMIVAPRLGSCVTIAVMSPKGGVGKTTVCALLGTLLAQLRRDRVVAVDTNPDFGSLGLSLAPDHDVCIDDLLEVLDSPELTGTALDANLGRAAHGLMVLPAPPQPARMARLDETAYVRVIRRLQSLVGMVLLDCGTGLQDRAARAALRTADQVLLVADATPQASSLVAEAAGLLERSDVPVWLVVNKVRASCRPQLPALEASIPGARGMLLVPRNDAAALRLAGGGFDWRDAPPGWQVAIRELAASLAAAWPG